jgi:hypothetical protein
MRVSVMFVMAVRMGVNHSVMDMCMLVPLGDVQPNADGHQRSGGNDERRKP